MLDARIKEELEDNPALEDPSLLSAESEEEYEELDEKPNEETAQEERTEDDFNIDDYLQDDDRSEYVEMMSYGGDDEEDGKEIAIADGVLFYADLEKQLNLVKLDGRPYLIAKKF